MDKKYPISNQNAFLSTKEHWENLFKGSKLRLIILILISLIILGGIVYIIIIFFKPILRELFNLLNRNLGAFTMSNLVGLFVISIFASLLIIFLSLFLFKKLKNKKWFLVTIGLMLTITLFGSFAIDRLVGNPSLTLNLYDSNNTVQGIIECTGSSGPLFVNDKITCKTKLEQKDLIEEEISMNLYFNNNFSNYIIQNNLNNSYFTSYYNVTYISFYTYETKNNSRIIFSTGRYFTFLTQEQFNNNRDRFIGLLIALMAAVFISIPLMMINIRKLWSDED